MNADTFLSAPDLVRSVDVWTLMDYWAQAHKARWRVMRRYQRKTYKRRVELAKQKEGMEANDEQTT